MTETNIDLSSVAPAEATTPPATPEQTDNNQPENAPENELIDIETATFAPISLEGQTPQVQVTDARGHQETISLDDFKKKYGGLESARVFLEQWRTTLEDNDTKPPTQFDSAPQELQGVLINLGLPINMLGVQIVDAATNAAVLNINGRLIKVDKPWEIKVLRESLPGFEESFLHAQQQFGNDGRAKDALTFVNPDVDLSKLHVTYSYEGGDAYTISDGQATIRLSRKEFAQWLDRQPQDIQARYQYLRPEYNGDVYESAQYRLQLENSPDRRVHIVEHVRNFFEGQTAPAMPREAIDQFRQRIMDGNPQELLARYRGDEIFNQLVEQHQIGTNPDGSPQIVLTLNEAGVSTLLEGLAPSALLANHSDSQFLRDMFGSVPELARTYQQFEQFEGNLREIEQDIENEIVRLGQKYNFPENVNTLPSPAREQESLRIATILCRELANRNQYQYDQIYANNNEYMAIPAKYQRTYEEGLVANQKRGMCTSFSSFYQHALEHYGVSSVLLNGTRLNLFGSSDGDSPSIASRHAFVGVRVSGDSENPIYHIFDPTQGRYGEGTSDYSYYVEPSAYTYASSMLRGAFTGGYQQYHRLSARQAFLKTISGTSIDRDIIDQIK